MTFYLICIIKVKPHYLQKIIKLFLSLFFIFTFLLIIKIDYESKIALPFIFLSSAIFLQGKRAGFYWFIALFVFLLIAHFSSLMEYKFSNITVIMMLVFLFAHYLVLLLYENQQNESNEKLEKEEHMQQEALDNFKILIDPPLKRYLFLIRIRDLLSAIKLDWKCLVIQKRSF